MWILRDEAHPFNTMWSVGGHLKKSKVVLCNSLWAPYVGKFHLVSPAIFDLGDPPGGREAGGRLRDALRGDVGPRRHQRGARLHRADQGHLRPGAVRRHHHPGGLGRREERVRAQRRPLLGGSDQERPPLSVLIWGEFLGTEGVKGGRAGRI